MWKRKLDSILSVPALRRMTLSTGLAVLFVSGLALISSGEGSDTRNGLFTSLRSAHSAIRKTLQKTIHSIIHPDLKNWGLFSSQSTGHISIFDAWKISRGNSKTLVAVIDTGIDANHPELAPNIWKAKNNREYGFDFVLSKPNPSDQHGHGTHVAGIIGAVSDFDKGVSGVAPEVSLMAVRYYSDTNSGAANLKNTVRSIHYAIENGARIINYSGGGPEFSEEEYLALKRAEAAGILVVAAAGNEKQDSDLAENHYYPSAYRLSNIISVAAINKENNLLRSSNWGKKYVDVAAPGEGIYSTLPGGKYGTMSGTSQATAFVSGIAALLLSKNPKLTPSEIKFLIRSSVDPVAELSSKIASGGKVNAYRTLLNLNPSTQPGQPGQIKQASVVRKPVSLMNFLTFPSKE